MGLTGASRRQFLGGALCGGLARLCQGEQGLTLPITRTRTRLAVVPVLVGRKRLRFVVDTGAYNTLIATEALAHLAPDDFEVRGAALAGFAGGRAAAERIALRWFSLSSTEGTPQEVNAMGFSRFRRQIGAQIDGVLGIDVLQKYSLRLDLHRHRLDLLAFRAPADHRDALADVVFEFGRSRIIRFPAEVSGQPVTAILDTGAIQTLVNWAAAEQAGINRSTPGLRRKMTIVGGDGILQAVHEFRFSEMRIGSLVWNRPTLLVADALAFESMQLAGKPAAVVGMDLWDNREIDLSFSEGRLMVR